MRLSKIFFLRNHLDVVANVLDCDQEVGEFEPQARYYINIRTNTHGEGMNPIFTPALGWKVSLPFSIRMALTFNSPQRLVFH